ncbi:hypothetical protein A3K80_09260 [Candidatus Bathyarchaeota archaeon RBG_13_38_9]|nr:MAG: hypothetical protein A3K80_09260 [Candidatus Bathyarchaeota archaeon RBG_13_38_9]
MIDIGELSLHHPRVRYPYSEEESKIRCDRELDDALSDEATIKIADHYQCEKCGEIWLNLSEVGFECLQPNENMPDMLAEYIKNYDPPKMLNSKNME